MTSKREYENLTEVQIQHRWEFHKDPFWRLTIKHAKDELEMNGTVKNVLRQRFRTSRRSKRCKNLEITTKNWCKIPKVVS